MLLPAVKEALCGSSVVVSFGNDSDIVFIYCRLAQRKSQDCRQPRLDFVLCDHHPTRADLDAGRRWSEQPAALGGIQVGLDSTARSALDASTTRRFDDSVSVSVTFAPTDLRWGSPRSRHAWVAVLQARLIYMRCSTERRRPRSRSGCASGPPRNV